VDNNKMRQTTLDEFGLTFGKSSPYKTYKGIAGGYYYGTIILEDRTKIYLEWDEIYKWEEKYDSLPTECKTQKEFEDKLLVLKI